MGLAHPFKPAEYDALKKAYLRVNGDTPDEELPGVTILERMEAEAEGGEITAPRLNEIPSRKEVKDATKDKNDTLGISIQVSTKGTTLVQPVRVKIPMPETTEDFRYRISLLVAALEFIKIRVPQAMVWSTSSEKIWKDHVK